MPSRRVIDLDPKMQPKAMLFATRMAEVGIPFMFTRTRATLQEQEALYAQGRQLLDVVNKMRAALMWEPLRERNNVKVTDTLKSKHLIGEAFDIAIINNGLPTWEPKVSVNQNDIPDYTEAGQIGESIGLRWGGRFKSLVDLPHFEWA